MRYFYADADRRRVGPVSDREVARLMRDGVLQPDSPLMAEGGTAWETVGALVQRRSAVMTTDYRPPIPTQCQHCNAALVRDTKWCPKCSHSTREHVGAKLASPLKRLAAAALDSLVPAFGTGIVIQFSTNSGIVTSNVVRTIGLIVWAIWSMMLFSNGMTLGKWVLGLYVIDESGDTAGFFRMLLREFVCKPLAAFPFLLGLAWVLVDKNNQGWHDKLARTYVVED